MPSQGTDTSCTPDVQRVNTGGPPPPSRLVPGVLPTLLRPLGTDEHRADRAPAAVTARYRTTARHQARRIGTDPVAYAAGALGTAAALRAVDAAAGGGFFAVPEDATVDEAVAASCFGDPDGPPVVDVQTHLVNPQRWAGPGADALGWFLRSCDPDRWDAGIDPERIGAAEWAAQVFGASETAVAVLTSPPGMPGERVLTNGEIAAAREVVERYAGSGRVRTHAIVHPNLPEELAAMPVWAAALRPDAWKAYTLWEPPGSGRGGWFLDDEATGVPFLEQVRASGVHRVAVHKGIAGPIPDAAPAGSSPRDVGPAAVRFPDLTFLVYHSGYDPDPHGQEGPHEPGGPHRGVSRLVASLADAGVGPGGNVYAELGSTWFLMLRRPEEAAHVLGKLLSALGPDRILWGTDCVWYGSPQPLIDAFRAFTIPERLCERHGYPLLTPEVKRRILGRNALEAYDLTPPEPPDRAWVAAAAAELAARMRLPL
jgi:uncharacterized protein